MTEAEPLLSVRDLETHYRGSTGLFGGEADPVRAVDGVSFDLRRGETLGLVGESGCGKSTLAASVLRLEEPTGGTVRFDGEDVTSFPPGRLKRFRREAQLVLQDPGSSFDPRMRVGASVTEPLAIHGLDDRRRRREIGEDLLERVGLEAAAYDRYPHEFSGGQLQRLALARALVVDPRLLVADEPVSALDVSVQSAVLSLLADLQAELDLALLLVSHDLSVVREVADRVAVMYLGELVEVGPVESVFAEPAHPYTEALVSAIPEPDPADRTDAVRLSGAVPDAADPPSGCRFHTRCPAVIQPDGVDVAQPVWRRLVDARDRLAAGAIDVEAVAAVRADGTGTAAVDLGDDALATALREELDLADPVGDQTVEAALRDAVDALVGRDPDRAADRLSTVVETPCSTDEPALRSVDAGRRVACHLHHPVGSAGSTGEPSDADSDGTRAARSAAPDDETDAADSAAGGFEWVGEEG